MPKPMCDTPLLPSSTHVFFAHAAEEVCRCLEGPAKLDSRRDDAASDFERPGKLDREVRVEQGHFFNAVLRHQVNQLRDHPLGGERIEAAFVEHHVCAVVAGIGAADAGGVSNLSGSAEFLVRVKVGKVKGWNGKRVQGFHVAIEVVHAPAVVLPRDSRDHIQRTLRQQRFGYFHQGDFALSANDDVDERLAQGFIRQQSGMPTAKDDR